MCLVLALLASGVPATDEKDQGVAAPFECAYSRSFCFDETGARLIGVTQRGELLYWPSRDAARPVVILLERKKDGGIFDRGPMSAELAAKRPEAILFYHDGRVQVWDLEAKRKIKEVPNDRAKLGFSRRSPDGKRVASVSSGGWEGEGSMILFWNTNDWSSAGRIECNDTIYDFCFTPDSRQVLLAVGYPTDKKNNGFTGIVAWDIEDKKEVESIEYGGGFPVCIAMSSDGRLVATGGGDAVPTSPNGRSLSGHLRIFDWKAKKLAAEPYTLSTDYVRAVAFSPDSKHLYSGAYGVGSKGRYQAEVRCFSAANHWKKDGEEIELGSGNPHEMTMSPDGRVLLVPDSDGLKAVDAQARKVIRTVLKFKFYPEDKEEFDRMRGGKKKKG